MQIMPVTFPIMGFKVEQDDIVVFGKTEKGARKSLEAVVRLLAKSDGKMPELRMRAK